MTAYRYPYVVVDDMPLLSMDEGTGIAQRLLNGLSILPAYLANLNSYRTADKLITRMTIESLNIYEANGASLHVGLLNAAASPPIYPTDLPIKVFISGFTSLGTCPNPPPATPRNRSIAEFIPTTPVLIRNNEQLSLAMYYTTDQTPGINLPAPCRITTVFQYANEDGTPPDKVYQG